MSTNTPISSRADSRPGAATGSSSSPEPGGASASGSRNASPAPLGRAGASDDVAHLLLFFASSEAGYITGQSINVNGGMFTS